jgi:hypothetical protein
MDNDDDDDDDEGDDGNHRMVNGVRKDSWWYLTYFVGKNILGQVFTGSH